MLENTRPTGPHPNNTSGPRSAMPPHQPIATRTLLIALALTLGCSPTEDGADTAAACLESELARQCPRGSDPILGAMATELCEASASGDIETTSGAVSGRCYGEGGCQVICQFSDPCRCGVERITEDGVVCVDCQTVASCGDGVCEDGETDTECPEDCGAVCDPGQQRCDGAFIQVCNLNGRYDTLPCPTDEVCVEIDATSVDCQRDDIVGVDTGMGGADTGGDAGEEWIAGGRVLLGPARWAGSADEEPPAEQGRPTRLHYSYSLANDLPGRFGTASDLPALPGSQLMFGPEADRSVVCHQSASLCLRLSGWVELPPVDDYCAAQHACAPWTEEETDCATEDWQSGSLEFAIFPSYGRELSWGGPYLNCVYDYFTSDRCVDSQTPTQDAGCFPEGTVAQVLPEETSLTAWRTSPDSRYLLHTRRWQREETDGYIIQRIDLDTGEVTTSADIADYRSNYRQLDVNNNGDVAFLAWPPTQDSTILGYRRADDDAASIDLIELADLPIANDRVDWLALSPNGRAVALAIRTTAELNAGYVVVINLDTREEVLRIRDALTPVAFSPRNHHLAVRFIRGNLMEVWDLSAPARVADFEARIGYNNRVAFNPAGTLLATWTGRIFGLWEVDSSVQLLEQEQELNDRNVANPPVRFSRDGRYVWAKGNANVDAFWGP